MYGESLDKLSTEIAKIKFCGVPPLTRTDARQTHNQHKNRGNSTQRANYTTC